jgi:hypothetical protein
LKPSFSKIKKIDPIKKPPVIILLFDAMKEKSYLYLLKTRARTPFLEKRNKKRQEIDELLIEKAKYCAKYLFGLAPRQCLLILKAYRFYRNSSTPLSHRTKKGIVCFL